MMVRERCHVYMYMEYVLRVASHWMGVLGANGMLTSAWKMEGTLSKFGIHCDDCSGEGRNGGRGRKAPLQT